MVIGVAQFAIQYLEAVDNAQISSWIFPQDREKGFYDYALAVPITQWFIDRVGPYPFNKLANVQSKLSLEDGKCRKYLLFRKICIRREKFRRPNSS